MNEGAGGGGGGIGQYHDGTTERAETEASRCFVLLIAKRERG